MIRSIKTLIDTRKYCQKQLWKLPHYVLILSGCKKLRMASLNYAEGQLVSTTVTAYVAGSSITSRVLRSLFAE